MRLIPARFLKRKAVFVAVAAVFLVATNAWAAVQTIRLVGGEEEYQQLLDQLDARVKRVETLLNLPEIEASADKLTTAFRSSDPSDLGLTEGQASLEDNQELELIFPSLLTALTINSGSDDKSGLTLSQLSNSEDASASARKVLTVDADGLVKLVDNDEAAFLPSASGGNPLYFDGDVWKAADDLRFSSGRIGIGRDPGVELDVSGTGAFQGKVTIYSDWEDHLLELYPSGDTGYLSSTGGALYINNTNNPGTGIGIFSDAGAEALGNMINVKVDNPLYNQAAFYMNYDGLSNAVEIVANTNDTSSNALSVTNFNQLDSAVGIIGYETSRGTVKISHRRDGASDANASGLSIDLQGTGTAAQGIYVDSTATGGTSGNLLRLRNQTVDRFVVGSLGSLTLGANGTNTSITKYGNTSGDEFFVGTNGAFRVQRSVTDSEAFRTQIVGDTQGRWLGTADGKLKWGDGSSAQDVVLQRGGANHLQLDEARFEIVSNTTNTDIFTLTASDGSRLGRFVETGGGYGWFEVDDNSGTATVLLRADGGDSYFRTGQLGVGTNAPNYDLEVSSNDSATYVANFFNDGNNANRYGVRIQGGADDGSGTTYYIDAYDGDGDQVGYIANTSGTFALTDISDVRTKTNIEDTDLSGLDIVTNLRVVDFNRLANPTGPTIRGFIAQEVQQVFPEAVTVSSTGLLGIQKSSLIPVLTKAIQEQQLQLNQLGEMVDAEKQQPTENQADDSVDNSEQFETLKVAAEKFDQNVSITDQAWKFIRQVVFSAKAVFEQSVEFLASVTFRGKIQVNQDTAGVIEIPAGSTKIAFSFGSPFTKTPVVQLTPQGSVLGAYSVQEVSTNGFVIRLDQAQESTLRMNWFAVMSENDHGGSTQVLETGSPANENQDQTPEPTPHATATPEPTPSPTVSPDTASQSASES